MTKASIVALSQRWLAPFSSAGFHGWPPDNPSSSWASQGAFTWPRLNSVPDETRVNEKSSGAWETLPFDDALSGKFVRTTRLSVTSAIGHGNFVLFSGVLICYCFITPSRRGEDFESAPRGAFHNRTLSPQKSTWRLWFCCRDRVLKSIS